MSEAVKQNGMSILLSWPYMLHVLALHPLVATGPCPFIVGASVHLVLVSLSERAQIDALSGWGKRYGKASGSAGLVTKIKRAAPPNFGTVPT